MIKPFRKYKTTVDWISDSSNSMKTCESVINLFDVSEWSSLENEAFGFHDSIRRTAVSFNSGIMYKCRVDFNDFDALMDTFLTETKLLDDRSIFPVKKKEIKIARFSYKGPVDFFFNYNDNCIVCSAYPKGVDPKTIEEAINNVLHSAIISNN